jgi:outer membrane protein OmpA-like peptidoglycan-associated protein
MVLSMKRIFKIVALASLLSCSSTLTWAQKSELRYADQQSELSKHMEAAQGYSESYSKKASYRAAKGAAMAYDRLNSYQEANKWWGLVVAFDEATSEDHSNHLLAIQRTGDLERLKDALETAPSTPAMGNINLDSLTRWYSNPKNVELIGVEAVNSAAADYGIAFDQQGNSYFSSDRGAITSSGKKSIRIDGVNKFDKKKNESTGRDFIKIYKVSGEGQPVAIKSLVPETYHFADPYFMKGKKVAFYSLTRDLGKVKKNRNYTIHPELFFSTVDDSGQFVDYKAFPYNSALEHGVITPFVDEQEKKIYFASDREGGLGGYDLYYVTYDDDFNFGNPVNLGPSVNTAGDERDPFLSNDLFYFASDGHAGLGGFDVFQATYTSGDFTGVKNLGLPYNSPQDDFAFRRNADGEIYISSNRPNGKGIDDIYKIEDLYRQFLAKVIDCEGNPVSEGLQVELIQKDNSLAVETKKEGAGILKADLAPEADFRLSLQKSGYFSTLDNGLTTKGLTSDLLEREYVMKKIPYKSVVFEDTIYYDFDDSDIRLDAEPVMKKVAEALKQFTFLEITVRSHTDSRASDEYNQALSERRANAVRDFLGDYGIARSRVKSEWFGEQYLVNDCGDGVPCPAAAHQQNRRSELILIAFPDENRNYEFPKELLGVDPNQFKELKLPLDCK